MHKLLLPAALALGALWVHVSTAPRPAQAGTAVQLGIEELVERSELVLEGRVTALEAGLDERGRIETRYTLAVGRTFLGDARPVRHVRLPGGVLPDGRGLVLPGLPVLALGEEALLFLTQEGRTGLRMPVGLAQGRLRLVRATDGTKTFVRDTAGLELVSPDGRPAPSPAAGETFDHAALTARIAAAADAKRALGRGAKGDGPRGARR